MYIRRPPEKIVVSVAQQADAGQPPVEISRHRLQQVIASAAEDRIEVVCPPPQSLPSKAMIRVCADRRSATSGF
jgi:hypothetical protein